MNCKNSSCLGYCILEVAGRLLEDSEKKKKKTNKQRGENVQGTKLRGYCPFLVPGRDAVGGIATGMACMRARAGGCTCSSMR